MNNVTWRPFFSKLPEFSKTNSCSYQKRETPEVEGALEQALVEQAMSSDTALICRTGFHREGENLNWHVLFVPSKGLREKLERNVGPVVHERTRK